MLLPLLSAFQIAAAQAIGPAGVYNGRLGQTSVALPRIDTTVVVDGRLDEPVWARAAILNGFSLYAPADGRPAPDSTEVRVWYSPDAIYFGIRAYADPGTIAATLADRDRIGSDDNVEIHLDTFHERNRAFVFIVNPLGIQADGMKSEGGGFIPGSNVGPGQNDLSADFLWESRGRLTAWGNFNMNERNQNSVFTLAIQLTGSDGSSITAHETTVFVLNANGTITVNFDKMDLTCG